MEDYEKLYKDVLAKAREIHRNENEKRSDMEWLFPELADSNDERIRKALLEMVHDTTGDELWVDYNVHKKEALAWLEKQGEQKPVLDFKASNWYVSKVDGKIHDMTYNPANKVEPKFKIGDYIVSDYCMGRVVEITNDAYLLDTEQGIPFSCEHNVHLWTIKDAKDGDMLIDKNYMGESPFIFKETKPSNIKTDVPNPLTVLGYCGIGGAGFTKSSGWGDTANCIYYPATKEQRELLFKKMKEAGYQWDAKKKELKKIELKPAWSDEDELVVLSIEQVIQCASSLNLVPEKLDKISKWLKSLKDRIGG